MKIKKSNKLEHTKYSLKKRKYYFECDIYEEDGSGYVLAKIGKDQYFCEESGNLNDWRERIGQTLDDLIELDNFLRDIEEKRNVKHEN